LKRLGLISWGAQDDPVEKYIKYKRQKARHNKRAASQIAKVQANIAVAHADAADNFSPFATSASQEPEHATREADALAAAAAREPAKTKIEPTPLTVNKTIFF
jgi:hypothetical protein